MRKGLSAGRGPRAAFELIRSEVPYMAQDREIHLDIAKVAAMIEDGRLLAAVEAAAPRA
jgi:histidine ammonia-lyase